jgi:hypothetical protein
MPGLQHSAFKGVHELLTNESERPHQEDIDDDLEGEQETLAELTSDEITTERLKTRRDSGGSLWVRPPRGLLRRPTMATKGFFFKFLRLASKTPIIACFIGLGNNVSLSSSRTS